MRYASTEQLFELDRKATKVFGIPSILLMENAAIAFREELEKFNRKHPYKDITVFCGKGNNGGDGFAIARHLYLRGFKVNVIYFQDPTAMKPDVLTNFSILEKLKIKTSLFSKNTSKSVIDRMLRTAGLIVDALFGIGLGSRPVEEPYKSIIQMINQSQIPVISVDVPSGLHSDTGEEMGISIRAQRTITFTFPKLGFSNPKSRQFTGKIIVRDISIPVKKSCHLKKRLKRWSVDRIRKADNT